jgi:L-threonylcarbamoyladenylate synthase
MVDKKVLTIQEQISSGISVLKQGGLVAFPTDTVYGLGASCAIPRAVERIYEAKERSENLALPLLLAEPSRINEVASYVSPLAWLLVRKFLPGALTLVLPASKSVSRVITGGGKTVAVRIPAHPLVIALIQGVGSPIIGTSANLSDQPSALTADEVYSQLGDKIDLVIDGGRCLGRESTIIDVTGEVPRVLREGAISREELKRCVELFDGE